MRGKEEEGKLHISGEKGIKILGHQLHTIPGGGGKEKEEKLH